jgi:tetratricopeptide (TPR) repeat protein
MNNITAPNFMTRTFRFTALSVTTLLAAFAVAVAQEPHGRQHEYSENVGQVHFPVSCNADAQKKFDRAAAWLHSFEYGQAEKVFTEVTVSDPKCAMGYWGIAMSNYHPLWAPPSAAELQNGAAAVEMAKSINVQDRREQDYIAAIDLIYKDSRNLDHRTRVTAFSDAMARLYERHPSDDEAGVFYALTLLAKGMMAGDKSYSNERKAAQILNRVLALQPQHPGVTHYLIHGYDFPALAEMALPAARSYAKIAPASSHAQHMPSHIFTRMGLWQEAIRSNLDAQSSAKAYAARNRMSGAWDEELHAMDYLAYAYLQDAQDRKALGVLNELYAIRKVEPPNFKVAYSFTAIPARYALERRRWNEAAKLPLHPGNMDTFPWESFRWAEAHIHFARAVGAARSGDAAAARQEVEKLAAIQRELAKVKDGYDWAKQADIQRQVASAWLAHAEGKYDEALALMRAAADLDDATDKHAVTPGSILPAREQLGELLIELKQPAAALQHFETSLGNAPNRFNGLYGAARAARLAADQNRARTYYKKLVESSRMSGSTRPETEEAKQFLAKVNVKAPAKSKR